MILVIGGIKGGSGKTTLATNLTVIQALTGKKVLLVDADEQKSASDWAEQRESSNIKTNWSTIQLSGKTIYSQLERLKDSYDEIIIDVGGRDTTSQRSALTVADKYLVPFKPRSLDIWTLGLLKRLINEISSVNPKLQCFSIINQADARGSDNQDANQVISDCEELTSLHASIGNRKAFCNAASEGLGVVELKRLDKQANAEINLLNDLIYKNTKA